MKKFIDTFVFALILALIFCSCNAKINTPKMPSTFKQNAVVTLGDFSFECEICKDESSVTTKINNTNAIGLIMIYDGTNLNFKYNEISYGFDASNFEKNNISIVIYNVINELKSEETKMHVIDEGVKYEGKTDFGSFVLIQSSNTALKSLSFKDKDFNVVFK